MSIYFDLQNNPVLITPNVLSVPKITAITYPDDDTAADTAGGQTITITGTGFLSGASVIINGSQVGVVSVVNSTTITFASPAQSAGSYVLYVVNTDGGTAVAVPGIQYSGTPTWSTASGSLGSYTETQAIANTVTATGDAPITYSLYSGSLPTGATLNTSNGYISGTSPLEASPTTFTFTIRATDGQQQDTNRTFSLTINPDVVTWSSPANGTTYTSQVNSAISNVNMSASAASGQSITYTANALPTGLSISGSNIYGTPTVVANSSTLLTATAATTNATATRTINWVITVANDTYFPYVTTLLSAYNSVSTFVADASTNNFVVTVNGDTKPNNLNPYTPGYYSNYFDGSGDYLSVPNSSVFDFSGNDFTVECWAYWISGDFAVFSGANNNSTDLVYYSNSFRFGINSVSWNVTISYTLTAYRWYHIAFVQQSSVGKVYVNGSLIGSGANANNYNTNGGSMRINISGDGSRQGNVYFSNLRVVKGTAVYTSNFTPSTSPLTAIANTSLLTCQSNRLIDNSTNNFTITKNGDTTVSGFIPFTPNSSYSTYGSGYFDGTGDYLSIAANAAFSFAGNFTWECWVYFSTVSAANQALFGNYTTNASTDWYIDTSTSTLRVYIDGGTLRMSTTVAAGAWYHVAIARSGSTITAYLNGTSFGTYSSSATIGSAAKTIYVGSQGTSSEYLNGYISDLRFVNGTAVYTTTFTPPTSPLTAIANTQLLTLQSNLPISNSMFVDNSTSNFLITRNGNTTQGAFSPYAGTWSNYFDGTGDYLTATLPSAIGTSDFTIEGWVFPLVNPSSDYSMIVDNRNSGTNNGVSVMYNQTTGYWSYFDGNTLQVVSSTTAISLNTWSHFALVRSSNIWKLFVNGTQIIANQTSSSNIGSTTVYIGTARDNPGVTRNVTGYISNIRINKTAVYTTTYTVPTAPLYPITGTHLLTCQSNRLIDNSNNNLTITKNGDTKIQKFSPFTIQTATVPTSYSMYFDGNGDYLTTPVFGAGNGSGLFTSGATFTVEAWFYQTSYITATSYINTIISDLTPTSAVALWWAIGTNNANAPVLQWYDGSTKTCTGSVALATYTWNHVAFVCDAGTISIYVNGTSQSLSGTTTITTPSGTNSALVVGADRGYYITGNISNLRVVKNVAVYTGNFTVPTSPLASTQSAGTNIAAITGTQTALLTCQSSTAIDNSTNLYAITTNGNSQPILNNPFGYTNPSTAVYTASSLAGSMYFDGTGDYLTTPSVPNLASAANWSAAAWVYPTGLSGGYNHIATASGFTMGVYGGTWYLTNANIGLVFGGAPVLNAWQHIAFVNVGGSSFKIYQNGNSVGSSGAQALTMGTMYIAGNGSSWQGYITDFQFIVNATTPLYSGNFLPPLSPSTAISNTNLLLSGSSAGVYDNSMNADYECVSGGPLINTSTTKFGAGTSSMYFNGTYLASNQNSDLFYYNSGNFTAEAWLYITATNSSSGIMGCWTNYSYSGWCIITSWNSNAAELRLYMYVGTGSAVNYDYTLNFPKNQWFHLAFVKNSTTFTTYVNGVSQISYGSSVAAGTGPLYIGAGAGLNSNAFQTPFGMNGYMSDVRITKGVARYTSTFTPPTEPFIRL